MTSEHDVFNNKKRLHNAQLITIPNVLKEKIGTGGIDPIRLLRAQEGIDTINSENFSELSKQLLNNLHVAIQIVLLENKRDQTSIETLIYPTMQLKSHGTMFKFPSVSKIADIGVNFLETVEKVDSNVMDITEAHYQALSALIRGNIQADTHPICLELSQSLLAACQRYYKSQKTR